MKKFLGLLLSLVIFCIQVNAKDLTFAQISDARYSKASDNGYLSKVIEEINKQKNINFVVFTGDNINRPNKEDLKSFMKEVKKLKVPFYIIIGDRDVNKRKDMSKVEYMKLAHKYARKFKHTKPNYVFEKSGVVFIAADGTKDVIPSTIGYYKDNVIDWVDANLALHSNKNVIILQHFPIIPPAEKENYYTYKADAYLEMLGKHENVKAVIAGHFGVNKDEKVNGVTHISTASLPYYRIIDIIDCDTSNPSVWAEIKEIR